MVVDWLRSVYDSEMRFYRGHEEVVVPIRWEFCKPDAKPLPFPHAFGSTVYDGTEGEGTVPRSIGEIRPERFKTVKKRTVRFLPGKRYCGTPEEWLHGCNIADAGKSTVNVNGVPDCCDLPGPMPQSYQADSVHGWQGALYFVGQADSVPGYQRGGVQLEGFNGQADSVPGYQRGGVQLEGFNGQADSVPGDQYIPCWFADNSDIDNVIFAFDHPVWGNVGTVAFNRVTGTNHFTQFGSGALICSPVSLELDCDGEDAVMYGTWQGEEVYVVLENVPSPDFLQGEFDKESGFCAGLITIHMTT